MCVWERERDRERDRQRDRQSIFKNKLKEQDKSEIFNQVSSAIDLCPSYIVKSQKIGRSSFFLPLPENSKRWISGAELEEI